MCWSLPASGHGSFNVCIRICMATVQCPAMSAERDCFDKHRQPSSSMTDSASVSCNHVAHMLQGILLPAVHNGECFSFCMCNPPFFETLQEAGRNPHTAYAGNLCSPLSAAFTLCRQVTSLRLCLCVSQLCIHLCATLFVCPIERTLMKLMCFSVQHGTELIKQLQYNRQKCQLQLCMSAGRFNRITRRAAMRLCVTF